MAKLATLEDVDRTVRDFTKLLADKYQELFAISEAFWLFPNSKDGLLHWPKGYETVWLRNPNAGVYLLFNQDEQLLYVGLSNGIAYRLNKYFQHADAARTQCRIVDQSKADARCVRVVLIDEPDAVCLCAALEWHLIKTLTPPLNKTYSRKVASQDTEECGT
jgi:hypothetical protein